MPPFKVVADFEPTGDQPQAIDALAESVTRGNHFQTLLGITGSGKTFTVAHLVERVQRPTLVISPNKSLAAQLANEFRRFLPNNAVESILHIELWGDEVERIIRIDPVTGEVIEELDEVTVYPATHYVAGGARMERAIRGIEQELQERLARLESEGKLLEAQRLRMRTNYDLEMMREMGFCSGIENYSRHIDGRAAGTAPYTLLDYFPEDWLCVIDESHVTVPQLHGMYEGDMSRKRTLVEYGFRLPSALDNRPLRFEEFTERVGQVVFMSATPGPYELQVSGQVVEQVVRPTGLIDPEVQVRPTRGQVDDLIEEIRGRAEANERVLVTTLTKKMAEDLTDYLIEMGIRVRYLHSEIDTVQRIEIIRDLRLGR